MWHTWVWFCFYPVTTEPHFTLRTAKLQFHFDPIMAVLIFTRFYERTSNLPPHTWVWFCFYTVTTETSVHIARHIAHCQVTVPLRSHDNSCFSRPHLILALHPSNKDFSQFCGLTSDNCITNQLWSFPTMPYWWPLRQPWSCISVPLLHPAQPTLLLFLLAKTIKRTYL